MPRRARLDAPGTLHHVIVRGIEKRRIVDDDNDRESFIQRLGELSQRSETAVHAWSLMTNHALCGTPHKACYVKSRIM
jgi:REP element-mobilizing transposase RayT